ncbi:MAG: phosphoenolpyruvate carboxykinase domain-containing protein, partial [Candidatus Aenigmarchaeota archaeon]|nr:phosphoenolpyruvate carboxykinase domain-containing protein [Candidatus Aenigmarchaeota archaeon]MDI6722807.1 phosphoenolpyruvate carboxykinase domain-containing protein [Candidatus Aenigmarchaeota archaeon]
EGFNHSGPWKKGKKDGNGKEIPAAHKNARYTVRIEELANADLHLHDPAGIPISGIIYGGRDSDTSPPVIQSLSWQHGVFIAASLESETTAATIGEIGIRVHDPMANADFLSISLGNYIGSHLKFDKSLDKSPLIFATNYFLKENGKFLNQKVDKKVWLMWMEGRIHDEYGAIETPVGFIPKHEDLRILFSQIFNREYTRSDYEKQFSIRTGKLLERLDRIEKIYSEEDEIPRAIMEHIEQQRSRLLEAQRRFGRDVISPSEMNKYA